MAKKEMVIVIDPEKCTGCHGCEMGCSMNHSDVCSPLQSRIRIHEFRDVNTYIPVTCQACEEAFCIKVCPMGARMRLESGAVVTNEKACIGCNACIYACPLSAPVINPDTGKSMSCDQCKDDPKGPACVRACTMQGALQYVAKEQVSKVKGKSFTWKLKEQYKPQAAMEDSKNLKVGF
jgi:Fe-S-cluster-containing dehydrogenase component